MGRTGPLFAHQADGIEPDVMTLGKGLGGGVPLAALLAREEVSCFAPGEQGGTYAGNPLMAAVGLAVLEELTRPERIAARERVAMQLTSGLEALSRAHGCLGVQGRGFLLALRLPAPVASEVGSACFERGLLVNAPRPERVRLMPSLDLSSDEVEQGLALLDEALRVALPRRAGSAYSPA